MEKGLHFERLNSLSRFDHDCINQIEELDSLYFPYSWRSGEFSKFVALNSFELYLLKKSTEIVGFIFWQVNSADSFAHLLKVVVRESDRRRGFGNDLLDYSISGLATEGFRHFYLEVQAENLAAIGVYLKNQFKIIHKKKSFYSDGADALIMTREVVN